MIIPNVENKDIIESRGRSNYLDKNTMIWMKIRTYQLELNQLFQKL